MTSRNRHTYECLRYAWPQALFRNHRRPVILDKIELFHAVLNSVYTPVHCGVGKLSVSCFRSTERVANVFGESLSILLVTSEEAFSRWWERRLAQIKPDDECFEVRFYIEPAQTNGLAT